MKALISEKSTERCAIINGRNKAKNCSAVAGFPRLPPFVFYLPAAYIRKLRTVV
jgi:hypothetical protein